MIVVSIRVELLQGAPNGRKDDRLLGSEMERFTNRWTAVVSCAEAPFAVLLRIAQ
jgi:hypothetical protein